MADMDYNPNPTFQVESAETNHEEEEENTKTNPEGLSVKIPNSRGSESPTVNTPMVNLNIYFVYVETWMSMSNADLFLERFEEQNPIMVLFQHVPRL